MPAWNGWLPREGFTSDALGPILKGLFLNPATTLPLILLARYTKKGEDLSILHELAYSRVKTLFYLGCIRYVSNYLSRRALNNGVSDKYTWSQEIVIVTGGAGGIGGEVVKLLAEKGIKVVVLDIIPMTYEAPSNVHYFKCDITSSAIIARVAAQIRSTIGTPTILINNAGVARGKTILESTDKDNRFTFDVNVLSHYALTREFLPAMLEANHGMIVTVASIASYLSVSSMVDYAASKAAALSFHEGLTTELQNRYNCPKIRTVVINQGYTKTALFQGYNNSSSFLVPPLEPMTVAEAIVKKVLTGESGQVIVPGFAKIFTLFRGFPDWYQVATRKDNDVMKGWHGRQVIDVEKDYNPNQNKDDESASTVIVPPPNTK